MKQLLDAAEAKILRSPKRALCGAQGFQTIQPPAYPSGGTYRWLYNRDQTSDITGAPTGFVDLDRMTSGLQPGDLIIVAGRPSMGKTAFSINIGENVAIDSGFACRSIF